MISIYSALILLSPIVPLILLFRSASEVRRRSYLLVLKLFLFFNAILYLLINWALLKVNTVGYNLNIRDLDVTLFEGATLLLNFFKDTRIAVAYALSIVIAGYFANQRSIQRIKNAMYR